jgi:HlyD family secretion protein
MNQPVTSKKRKKIIVFSLIGLVLAGLTLAAVFSKREAVISVQTEKVTRRDIVELVVANGRIQPVIQVKISPEVSGEIIELPIKEGQRVNKGDLILRIKPDFYIANRNQAEAGYKSSVAGKLTAEASLAKAEAEFKRHDELFRRQLISDSAFLEVKTSRDIARAQLTSATHQVEMSRASLARAEEELAKTTMVSPLTGTISKLNSQLGERVVGTATMAGTEVMIIADLNEMEARVDIGEIDIVLISPGQNARLEVDAFKARKFTGVVSEIANSSKNAGMGGGQEATKFEVKIRIHEKELFRPGMSVTANIETRSRTNALAVPLASVTTRLPKQSKPAANPPPSETPGDANGPASSESHAHNSSTEADKKKDATKPITVVFIKNGERVKMSPVKLGIGDDNYWEIVEGVEEEQEIISGSFRAINRELEDGKKIMKSAATKKTAAGKEP